MSPKMRPKSFGTFEKRAPGVIVEWLLTLDSHYFYRQLNLALAWKHLYTLLSVLFFPLA